jgi:hypothetical protein
MVKNGTAIQVDLASVGDVYGSPDANNSGVLVTVAMGSSSFAASYNPPSLLTTNSSN